MPRKHRRGLLTKFSKYITAVIFFQKLHPGCEHQNNLCQRVAHWGSREIRTLCYLLPKYEILTQVHGCLPSWSIIGKRIKNVLGSSYAPKSDSLLEVYIGILFIKRKIRCESFRVSVVEYTVDKEYCACILFVYRSTRLSRLNSNGLETILIKNMREFFLQRMVYSM